MRKYLNFLISIFICFLCSCTFNVSNSNKDNNQPPAPSNPDPSDGAAGISLTPQLYWECNGNNNNNVWFDVYLDTCNPPSCIQTTGTYSNYYPVYTPLKSSTTYYWKICAKNDNGECDGNIWRFTTSESGLPVEGLVAYYPFNGNTNDASGNGNNGQNNGAGYTVDRFNLNQSCSFNGANSYIMVPHNTSLQPTDGLTLSAWVKFNYLSSTSSVLTKGSDTLAGCYSLRYQSTSHKLDFQINFSDYIPGPRITVSSSSTIQSDMWYNAICTFGGNAMKIYLNGQLENSIYVSKSLGSNYDALVFGNSEEGYSLNGDLDDIRIYKRALNDDEIQQLYHEGGWQKK